jgi:hypothetical protein
MENGGALNDLGQLTTLLSNAQSYLMYDSGWNLIQFAQDVRALSSSNLSLSTLPEISTNDVYVPGYPSLQSVDFIDVPQIQQQVNAAFYGSSMIPSTASSVTVSVYNGSGTDGLAGDVSQDLVAMGYKAGTVADASSQSQPVSADAEVFYGAGSAAAANAQVIANVMGVQSATPLSSLPAGQVEVLLGSQVTAQAPGLEMFGADSVNASDYIDAAEQNGQSIPANVQAAGNVGSQSDVPAYSQPLGTPSAPASGSAAPSGPSSPAATSSAPGSAKKPASSSPPAAPYGLTTCPY